MLRLRQGKLHPSWMIVAGCAGVISGTVFGQILRVDFFGTHLWTILTLIVLVFAVMNSNIIVFGLAFVAGAVLALSRISVELKDQAYIQQFYGKTVLVEGIVDGDPEHSEADSKIKIKNLKFGEEKIPLRGNIYITMRQNKEIARADRIVLQGELLDGFGTYVGYFYKPKISEILRPEPGDLVLRLRNWFASRAQDILPQPQVNLGLSYLLGMKSDLPKDLNTGLRTVGLVHIVVASGAHLSILVEVARKIFGKISRFSGLVFSLLFVLFFMAMVGWTPSIMRAGMMTFLNLIAWYFGRKIAPWRIILIVMASTLIIEPMYIVNLGWQLSFASFAGITILGPHLTKYFFGDKKINIVASTILMTISATLMTLPITLYHYGQISALSLLANVLILPTLPWAMGLVFAVGIVSTVPVINLILSFLTEKVLDFHILVVNFFSEMPEFLFKIPLYRMEVFWFYAVVIGFLLIVKWRRWRKSLLSRELT